MNSRIFVWNPKKRSNAKAFKETFGIDFKEGTSGNHTIEIATVHKLSLHGIPYPYGAFAAKLIPENEIIAEYTGIEKRGIAADDAYVYRIDETKPEYIDGKTAGNISRFVNHSDSHNCSFIVQNNKVFIKTLRLIQPGEQLTVNYGPNYWKGIDRIYLNTHDNWETPAERYQAHENHYQTLGKAKLDAATKAFIQKTLNCSNPDAILVPRLTHTHLPILVRNHRGILPQQYNLTLFHVYCHQSNLKMMQNLLSSEHTNTDLQCSKGMTALSYIIQGNASEPNKINALELIFNNRRPKVTFSGDANKRTIFHYCIENNLLHCLNFLVRNLRFDLSYFDNDVPAIIPFAIESGNLDALKLLITKIPNSDLKKHMRINQAAINTALDNASDPAAIIAIFLGVGYRLNYKIKSISDSDEDDNEIMSQEDTASDNLKQSASAPPKQSARVLANLRKQKINESAEREEKETSSNKRARYKANFSFFPKKDNKPMSATEEEASPTFCISM
ncbi:MAG: SET domain-containing protein-lysine N-methyltransferase [Gammaproteobacteria bacterium]|nr:SET domain-containing protein-lysine N-methyltransferase [Gammaproteobacteria bacterium]